jgi:alkanesulfonate monooxygenase SsuD/methylene tetrahydromethanopterin reductase-like flavin-dependent oxidoreductase (luciferase family)
LKFGMNVLALGFREPLLVAKECATIDYLSGGRLLPAFGVGSLTSPDWAAMGRQPQGQGARIDEALDIIARLWRGESVSAEGPHFELKDARLLPLPVQRPLPLWIGGSGPAAIRRTARIGTGWLAGLEGPAQVARTVAAIRGAALEAGRAIDPEHFGAGFSYRFGAEDDPIAERRRGAYRKAFPTRNPDDVIVVGGPADIVRRMLDYEAAGVTKFVLRPIGEGDMDFCDQTRRLIEEVIPAVHGRRPPQSDQQTLGQPSASPAVPPSGGL